MWTDVCRNWRRPSDPGPLAISSSRVPVLDSWSRQSSPANTRHWHKADSVLAHRLPGWSSTKPALGQCLVFSERLPWSRRAGRGCGCVSAVSWRSSCWRQWTRLAGMPVCPLSGGGTGGGLHVDRDGVKPRIIVLYYCNIVFIIIVLFCIIAYGVHRHSLFVCKNWVIHWVNETVHRGSQWNSAQRYSMKQCTEGVNETVNRGIQWKSA